MFWAQTKVRKVIKKSQYTTLPFIKFLFRYKFETSTKRAQQEEQTFIREKARKVKRRHLVTLFLWFTDLQMYDEYLVRS